MNKKLIRLTESDLHRIVRESVNKVLNEVYTGDEPYVPNNYPGTMPKFKSKGDFENWKRTEAPDDWFDWRDDRKFQRTGVQPSNSGLANSNQKNFAKTGMKWSNDRNYSRFKGRQNNLGLN